MEEVCENDLLKMKIGETLEETKQRLEEKPIFHPHNKIYDLDNMTLEQIEKCWSQDKRRFIPQVKVNWDACNVKLSELDKDVRSDLFTNLTARHQTGEDQSAKPPESPDAAKKAIEKWYESQSVKALKAEEEYRKENTKPKKLMVWYVNVDSDKDSPTRNSLSDVKRSFSEIEKLLPAETRVCYIPIYSGQTRLEYVNL